MKDTKNQPDRATVDSGPGPAKEVIAKLAALIREEAGRPEGYDLEFWLLAETALRETNEAIRHEAES